MSTYMVILIAIAWVGKCLHAYLLINEYSASLCIVIGIGYWLGIVLTLIMGFTCSSICVHLSIYLSVPDGLLTQKQESFEKK